MKALIIYYTMSGRTKKIAKAIARTLTNYEVTFSPFEISCKFYERMARISSLEKGDFSSIDAELKSLDVKDYDLIVFGMPTYGNKPPNAFNEIMERIGNLEGKKAVVYATARLNGGGTRKIMKANVEAKGAQVINQALFIGPFWMGTKKAIKFGQLINES
ncbi:MAG TPA: NAD(P)H-dependent oxidoreductase [Candidatus Bathyarchaeia archaeon]|nr:NAD(P)H-dependent oxidoreductase [Candidatus Bathyarchaeia archaeon]